MLETALTVIGLDQFAAGRRMEFERPWFKCLTRDWSLIAHTHNNTYVQSICPARSCRDSRAQELNLMAVKAKRINDGIGN